MKARCGDIDIHYTIEGDGPWLTMSHSLACDLSMWDVQAKALAKHFKVLRYDTRGHGQSSAPQGPYSLDTLAQDAYALLQHLGIQKTHWVGLSLGGMIGQAFTLAHPETISSLVLADTTSRGVPNAAAMWADRAKAARTQGMQSLLQPTLARWFTPASHESGLPAIQQIAQVILGTPPEGYAGCCEAIAGLDFTERLAAIHCPTLVMVGDQDQGTPPDMSRIIHQHIPGSELLLIANAAHLANVEQPEAFTQGLLNFLLKARGN